MMPSGSKTALSALLPRELGVTQLEPEPRHLDRADAVLAGDRAAEREPQPDDVVERLPRPLEAVGVVVREDDRRVQVAVAGMTADRHEHRAALADRLDAAHELGEAADGHADVLGEPPPIASKAVLMTRAPASSPSDSCASSATATSMAPADSSRAAYLRRSSATWPGRSDCTSSTAAQSSGKPKSPNAWIGSHARAVDDLEQAGAVRVEAQRDDAGDGGVEGVEDGERRQGGVGRRSEPHDGLGDDAERALRADEEAGEVVAGHPLGGAVAGAHDLPAGEHDLQRLDPVGGHAVLHAAQAARVGRDVAPDRARLPRRGVGPVEEALPRRPPA